MNYIDLLLIIIILLCIWASVKQGFILSSLSLLSWVGSLAAGFLAYRPLASFLHDLMPFAGFWLPPLSFMIGVLLGKLLFDVIITWLLNRIPGKAHNNPVNKLLGAIPGVANGLIWAILLSGILLLVPFTNGLSKQTRESALASRLVARITWLDDSLSPVFSEALNSALPKKHKEAGHDEFIKLPFKVNSSTPAT